MNQLDRDLIGRFHNRPRIPCPAAVDELMTRAEPLPPEGLWIAPNGRWIPVVEHLMALIEYPFAFGLTRAEVGDVIGPQLQEAALRIIGKGWIRYRHMTGRYYFEAITWSRAVEEAITGILGRWDAQPFEEISFSQADPPREYRCSVMDFVSGRLLESVAPVESNTWRFSVI